MGGTFDTLNVAGAKKSGILQIVTGSLCILFNIAIFVVKGVRFDYLGEYGRSGSGIWGGVFYVVAGSLLIDSSKKRSLCSVVAALTLNSIALFVNLFHVIWMSAAVMSEERRFFSNSGWDGDDYRVDNIVYAVYVSLFSISTLFAYVEFVLCTWAVFLLSEAFYWRRFNEHRGVKSDVANPAINNADGASAIPTSESSFNHALAVSSAKANAVLQALFAVLSAGVNIAAIIVVRVCLKAHYERMNLTNGTAIITAPFFCAVAYFGFTAGKTGCNKRIVTFLAISAFCCLLAFLEGGGGVVAVANRWDMEKPRIKKCETKPDGWGYNKTTCDWFPQENEGEFVPTLISLNAIIILFALFHLALSIWGVVIGSKALHKDGTCFRCCRNCFCGSLCSGGSGCADGGAACGDNCCTGNASAGAHYQPIQFVVTHQGTTTLANGQQALVVLLPLNGNMSFALDGQADGRATVTVDDGQMTKPVVS